MCDYRFVVDIAYGMPNPAQKGDKVRVAIKKIYQKYPYMFLYRKEFRYFIANEELKDGDFVDLISRNMVIKTLRRGK